MYQDRGLADAEWLKPCKAHLGRLPMFFWRSAPEVTMAAVVLSFLPTASPILLFLLYGAPCGGGFAVGLNDRDGGAEDGFPFGYGVQITLMGYEVEDARFLQTGFNERSGAVVKQVNTGAEAGEETAAIDCQSLKLRSAEPELKAFAKILPNAFGLRSTDRRSHT